MKKLHWLVVLLVSCGFVFSCVTATAGKRRAERAEAGADKDTEEAGPPAEGFESRVYKTADGQQLTLQIAKPAGWQASDKRPAILFFHGGGWMSGSPSTLAPHAHYFAERGLVTVLVEYRLTTKKDPPTKPIQDAKSSIRWVRRHAEELGIDPNRIATSGMSAGGHLAAFLGIVDGLDDPSDDRTVSARSNAMILYFPVFDNGPSGYGYDRIGASYKQYSPIDNVRAGDPPAIVFLGDRDEYIPVATVCRFQAEMQAAQVPVTVRIFAGQPHGFVKFEKGVRGGYHETLKESDEFLIGLGWLKGPPTIEVPGRAPAEARGCTSEELSARTR